MEARDSQRSKVYKAEREWWSKSASGDYRFTGIVETRDFVQKVCNSSFVRSHYGKCNVRVKDGRGTRIPRGSYSWINLPVWARTKAIVLHELSHSFSMPTSIHASHGWRFCDTYLRLVQHFMGAESANLLKSCFKNNRVKFRPPQKKCLGRKGNAEALRRWREQKKLCKEIIDGQGNVGENEREGSGAVFSGNGTTSS